MATAQNLPLGGGSAVSASHEVETEVGQAGAGASGAAVVQSASFRFHGGAVWSNGALAVPDFAPAVFGVAEGFGDKDGGETVQVVGFNFDVPSGSGATVSFDGVNGANGALIGNTLFEVDTPTGVNVFGNPKGSVDVGLANVWGSSTAEDAFLFTPCLSFVEPPRIGRPFRLSVVSAPVSFWGLALGTSALPVVVPLPPFDGALEILLNLVQLQGATLTLDGQVTFDLFIPDSPALIGYPMELQGISITAIFPDLEGSWTNRIVAVIES